MLAECEKKWGFQVSIESGMGMTLVHAGCRRTL